MKPTQKTSQRPIRDKEAITRSQWEFRQKNKEIARSAEKRERTERKKSKKKPVFGSETDDIQQTPVTPNTFSSPKVLWTKNS